MDKIVRDDLYSTHAAGDDAIALGEPSLADAMAAIAADAGLSAQTRLHWLTSLRRIAEGIGRPPESLPARITALRHPISRLSAARMGISAKTLANHKSNARAALQHFLKVADVPRRGATLSRGWATIMAAIVEIRPRRMLSGLARYCSTRGIAPGDVDLDVIGAFFAHRTASTFLADDIAQRRALLRSWNDCVDRVPGWPSCKLEVPDVASRSPGPDWTTFPQGLRDDIDGYLQQLAKPHHSANGKRRRPCKASTVATRRRELTAFASTAVAAGVAIENLSSLQALLAPAVVHPAFERYLGKGGSRASLYVIDLAWKLLSIARIIAAPPETIAALDDIRATLEQDRGPKLTAKNLAVIREVLTTDVWPKVTSLPFRLMEEAMRLLNRSPRKAAAIAALATQIAILTRAPIRVGNLMAIRIGTNLIRPGGDRAAFHLVFPEYDVKNRVDLNFVLPDSVSELIDRYIDTFRKHLCNKGQRSDWLFPGVTGKARGSASASEAIAQCVERHAGLRVTAHQFRHAAAALILKHDPGNYEFARRVLGHLNIQTTTASYTALESFNATGRFADLIEKDFQKLQQGKGRKFRS
jgi:integrase